MLQGGVSLVRERVEGMPAPPDCPRLPKGVRLIKYAPKAPPLAIELCSIVTNGEKFIQIKLAELGARLHNPVQIRAGDSVF